MQQRAQSESAVNRAVRHVTTVGLALYLALGTSVPQVIAASTNPTIPPPANETLPRPIRLPQNDPLGSRQDETVTSPSSGSVAPASASSDTTRGTTLQMSPAKPEGIDPSAPTAAPSEVTMAMTDYITVNQALNEALLNSPRAAAVRALLKIEASAYAAATIMPNPQVYRDEAPVSEQMRRIGVQKVWDPPWKLAFRLLAARRQVQEQKLELLNNLWDFRSQVRRAYLEVVIAQETFDTLSSLENLAKRLLFVSQKLFRAGSVAELDTLKADLAARQTEVDREQGGGRVALAKQQLNIIMGRHPDATLVIPRLAQFRVKAEKTGLLPNLEKPVPAINEFMELALSNRLELKIIKAQIALAEAQLKNAYGNVIPNPILVSGYSSSGNGPSGPKISGTFFTMNYEYPMFNFNQGEIVRLKATLKQYKSQILAQRNIISAQISSAYTRLMIARRRIAQYQDVILAESERVARLARRSYEVGQADITSTLASQTANVVVRKNYLDAVDMYQQAFTELEQAIGEPLI